MEEAEDPAGVGVFCLAPREVKISSGQKAVVITGKAWTGELVPVLTTTECVQGTMFQFSDEPWTCEEVERHTVFSGVQVTVDGALCAQEPFVTEQAKLHPELGCKIEICERNALSKWHNRWKRNYYRDDVLINFHGQVVQFSYRPVSEDLQVLVDLTGEPTAILADFLQNHSSHLVIAGPFLNRVIQLNVLAYAFLHFFLHVSFLPPFISLNKTEGLESPPGSFCLQAQIAYTLYCKSKQVLVLFFP